MMRRMEAKDLEQCHDIVTSTMGKELGDAFKRNVTKDNVDNPENYRIVADDRLGNGIVSALGGIVPDEMSLEVCWVAWFAVIKEGQGFGIGKVLMEESLVEARNRGYKKIYVETYDTPEFRRARTFYENAGFRPMGMLMGHHPSGTGNTFYMGRELLVE